MDLQNPSTMAQVANLIAPKLSRFTPHKPFAKQQGFLMLPHKEALYGGALGGGKSDALLMAALQYVHIPGHSSLLLRKHFTDLKQQGALLDRMTNWMAPFLAKKEIKYSAEDRKFLFPTFDRRGRASTPAAVQFGFIGESNARTRYQGAELQDIFWDEVAQHVESDYTYLFTRLRKCVCPLHPERDAEQNPIYIDGCEQCDWAKSVPLRIRSTCNPEGIGFAWVKKRFGISPDKTPEEAEATGTKVKWLGTIAHRPFLPASFKDNPYINHKEYDAQLRDSLSEDLYEALVEGSWGVVPNARFKKRWQRFYSQQGNLLYLGPNFTGRPLSFKLDIQEIFQTVDPAATSMEGPGDIDMFPTKIKNPSWTVISTWALTKCYNLLHLHNLRIREEIPEVVDAMREQHQMWKPAIVIVEENGIGKGVKQYASRMGMPIKGISKSTDKVENCTNAILQMSNGRIWHPQGNPAWMTEVEEELFTWQGHPQETDDIIDSYSLACNYVRWENAGETDEYFQYNEFEYLDAPSVFYPPRFNSNY